MRVRLSFSVESGSRITSTAEAHSTAKSQQKPLSLQRDPPAKCAARRKECCPRAWQRSLSADNSRRKNSHDHVFAPSSWSRERGGRADGFCLMCLFSGRFVCTMSARARTPVTRRGWDGNTSASVPPSVRRGKRNVIKIKERRKKWKGQQ